MNNHALVASLVNGRAGRLHALRGTLAAVLMLASAPVAAQPEPQPITDATMELSAGTWVDSSTGPDIQFTVEDGWYIEGPPLEGVGIALAHEAFDDAYMTITRFDGGVFPEPCHTEENSPEFLGSTGPEIEATADSLAAHLEGHPLIDVTSSEPVEVGSRSGISMDMRSDVAAECDPPWAWLWRLPIVEDFHLADDEDARFIALDIPEMVTVVAIEAFTGPDPEVSRVEWDEFLEVAGQVVDTIVITPA